MTTVPAPKPIASGRVHWGWVALVVLGGVIAVGALVFPTYANYDSTYSLLWGRELLHGHSPSFEAYRAPTEHPLGIAFGLLLAPLGQGADRLMVLATMLSFVVLVAGLYRLSKIRQRTPEPKRALIYGCADGGAIGACVIECA